LTLLVWCISGSRFLSLFFVELGAPMIEAKGPQWHVVMQPGKRRQLDLKRKWAQLLEQAEQLKASVRAKVEHPFHVVKNLFRHKKFRYKGLAKNEAQLFSLFGLVNLVIAKRQLLAIDTRGAS
jgi:transposase, IS5 family